MGIPSNQTYVTFSLADERFCTSVQHVREVILPTSYTRIPGAGAECVGVINVRGKIIPVVDVAHPLTGKPKKDQMKGRILIASSSRGDVGLLVDDVHGVVEVPDGDVSPAPGLLAGHKAVEGIIERSGHVIAIVDLESFVDSTVSSAIPPHAPATS